MTSSALSLKGRALKLLSQREHSRLELRRKLERHGECAEEIEAVLDELTRLGWLSEERFVESLVHRKGARLGVSRLKQELAQHGVSSDASSQALQALQGSEYDRACEVWRKRFGAPPSEPKEEARQMRFLLTRGFSSDVVRRVLRHASERSSAS